LHALGELTRHEDYEFSYRVQVYDIQSEISHFAITLLEEKTAEIRIRSPLTDRIPPIHRQNPALSATLSAMAGISGRSGPPGNQSAFIHGLSGIAQRGSDDVLNPAEQSIREEILPLAGRARAELHRSAPPCASWRRSSRVMCRCC